MKKRLLIMLENKEARKAELGTKAKATEDIQELRAINSELETLNEEIAELRSLVEELEQDDSVGLTEQRGTQGLTDLDPVPEQRSRQPVGSARILGTYGVSPTQTETRTADKFGSEEYRSAFMNYVLKGIKTEALEFRADATTSTGDIGAVIPTTIMNQIIEKMKDYGMIWPRVSVTNIKGGVKLPVASVKPTARWVAEGSVADKQKKTVSAAIVFAYYKLQIRVALTLESDLVSLPVFEQTVSDNISEAMAIGLEGAIISGSGSGEPLGIANDPDIPVAQVLSINIGDMDSYQTWTTIMSKLPRKYRNKAVLILNDLDWNKYIVGMVDANGQPVARTTFGLDSVQQERFLGREVIPVEDYLTSIDDGDSGDVFGIVCNLSDYLVNSNLQITYKRYFDEDTDEWISKSTLICDGKLGDKNGVLLLKKA